MIAIIDYGMGNIHSVNKALQLLGAQTKTTNNSKEIAAADKAVLPGVGAFDDAVLELEKQGLIKVINEFVKSGKPLLGICLGMQLFFEESEEAKSKRGLGLIKGSVKRFSHKYNLKVPHMGWNQIKVTNKTCPLFKSINDVTFVYFCHSYYPVPKEQSVTAATCNYGNEFVAAVAKDNLYGVQFHPEKSQKTGLNILEGFVKLC
ncbi:MAG: imidazole glycerol phosphate synthase subunit HisH [Candidatus Omnitrophota bacterium]|jgi:glutamine amidotransferase